MRPEILHRRSTFTAWALFYSNCSPGDHHFWWRAHGACGHAPRSTDPAPLCHAFGVLMPERLSERSLLLVIPDEAERATLQPVLASPPDLGVDEGVDVAVQYGGGIAYFDIGAGVLEQAVAEHSGILERYP